MAALRDRYDQHAFNFRAIHHERRFEIAGNGLNFGAESIEFAQRMQHTGIINADQNTPAQRIGKGTDFTAQMCCSGKFQFQ